MLPTEDRLPQQAARKEGSGIPSSPAGEGSGPSGVARPCRAPPRGPKVVTLPEADKPGQTPAPQTGCQWLSCIPGPRCCHTQEDPEARSHHPAHPTTVQDTLPEHSCCHPKLLTPLSLKYSQPPAPPKQASECSEDVGRYKAALGFVVSSYKCGET